MSSPFVNLAISLGAMQGMFCLYLQLNLNGLWTFSVARKIPFDEPDVLNYVRIAYVVSQIIVLGVYYYVSTAVRYYAFVLSYAVFLVLTAGQAQE